MLQWIKNHFNTLHQLQLNSIITDLSGSRVEIDEGFKRYIQYVKPIRHSESKLIFIGNGGSAGIASHLAIDYSRNGAMSSMTFSDASALTCLSNDYGYEYVFAKQVEYHARKNDVLIAISSSGRSINILNAVNAARVIGCRVITFSGFQIGNPLSKLGELNFYIDSNEYGYVEVAHLSLAHAMLDFILEDETSHRNKAPSSLVAVQN